MLCDQNQVVTCFIWSFKKRYQPKKEEKKTQKQPKTPNQQRITNSECELFLFIWYCFLLALGVINKKNYFLLQGHCNDGAVLLARRASGFPPGQRQMSLRAQVPCFFLLFFCVFFVFVLFFFVVFLLFFCFCSVFFCCFFVVFLFLFCFCLLVFFVVCNSSPLGSKMVKTPSEGVLGWF